MNTMTKYEVQAACDSARDKILAQMQVMQMENQAMFRQINAERDQSWRKITSLENQIVGLMREVRTMRRTLIDDSMEPEETFQTSSDLPALPVR